MTTAVRYPRIETLRRDVYPNDRLRVSVTYVVRDAGPIAMRDYRNAVGKFVRREFRPALPEGAR